ncbi:type 1 glutamine amidotransferase domain-containing protein [Nocardia sp. BSTN01]|uniref:type 1 glutamine amidotransferase domain-containing protein n=1 Tax=Nocardia sp. BSTN01 TaxID=2783665 RepID=UPI00188DDCEF|nr:type 1 glutamine amidotransferase domain-containing protein [Nocardia sp. BSTN01]MBF4997247.1 type 1 glutamine amidotransferase domain-containing protein [Nocardia sp. BSTN01]
MAEILFVMTGADHWTLADGTRHPTGYWAEEFTAPYAAFTGAGHRITIATPGAVVPTVDHGSLAEAVAGGPDGVRRITEILDSAGELNNPVRLEDVQPHDYNALYYPGGHGPMEDLAVNPDSAKLLESALAAGIPLGIVCHAPAALLATAADGESPFAGYRLTAFSNVEETQVGFADKAEWLLQDRLIALGADYREGPAWAPHIEIDRNVYTGQNPASSAPLAAALLEVL